MRKSIQCFIAFIGFIVSMNYGCTPTLLNDYTGMKSSEPATLSQDALISGNGVMGILVFGDPENEKLVFNHEFCYEPIGNENIGNHLTRYGSNR